MIKRLKIFESGIYKPQGTFSKERVKKIFGNVSEEVKSIFSHSSKWTNDDEAVELGYATNIGVIDKGNKSEVYADFHLNDKGETYYKDGILKGVSVEIPEDKLTKIAILPIGINPAVSGAEFSEQTMYFEYQEIEEEPQNKEKGKDKKMDRKDVLDSLTKTEVEEQAERLNITIAPKLEPKTEEQIAAEITAKLNKENEIKAKTKEFMDKNQKKITPAYKPFFEKLIPEVLNSEINWEFEKKETGLMEGLEKFMETMSEAKIFENYYENIEFQKKDGSDNSSGMEGYNEGKTFVEKIQGGKKWQYYYQEEQDI